MKTEDSAFELRLARDPRDLMAAQRLRYRVFVEEMGSDGPLVDHAARLEGDAFDGLCDHMLLIDRNRDADSLDDVVAVYRLLPGARLAAGQRFYSESEYDLGALRATGRSLLELGRSCVHPDYRGGAAMMQMWNRLADYVLERGIELMFGTASFPGTDVAALAQPLSYLWHNHLAPTDLRAVALPAHRAEMAVLPEAALDRRAAMQATPALIKAYLRLGGCVGDGAWVDHDFNTTDVLLVMDTAQMSSRHRDYYVRKHAEGQNDGDASGQTERQTRDGQGDRG
ncbi:GNAT family N-acetyltransferase [Gemmobacter serpentinus]|uniref:GNAT family N-acetyltransferase n=1 Tax=Gemmobacter serpentinus TaxID=2652247 RepID=UPI00124E5CDC|nr:GNAT family N-acyltransferase [Gemmobacter serpentinus]